MVVRIDDRTFVQCSLEWLECSSCSVSYSFFPSEGLTVWLCVVGVGREGRHGVILAAVGRGSGNLEHGGLCRVEASWAARAACWFWAGASGKVGREGRQGRVCVEIGREGRRPETFAILLKTRLCRGSCKQDCLF